ncbi:MAG: hypothetical protein HKN25_15125 [Pyrinomonadaceae bacterium]|nr:hypothetical protein [Pyrinomonadaceae bacterium]
MNGYWVHIFIALVLFFPKIELARDLRHNPVTPFAVNEPVTEFEMKVLAEINSARTNPESVIPHLERQESLFRGRVLYIPKQTPFLTVEGFPAVDEAIGVLRQAPKAQSLRISDGLVKAAKTQLADLLENPELGHTGKDGSNLSRRLDRIGISGKAGENITYTPLTARQVALKMLVDDGVKSRHHRENLLNPIFRLVGIGCEQYKNRRYICVIVFADKFVKSDPAKRLRQY